MIPIAIKRLIGKDGLLKGHSRAHRELKTGFWYNDAGTIRENHSLNDFNRGSVRVSVLILFGSDSFMKKQFSPQFPIPDFTYHVVNATGPTEKYSVALPKVTFFANVICVREVFVQVFHSSQQILRFSISPQKMSYADSQTFCSFWE